MKENRRVRLIALGTITYILLALTWWSVLLYQKNQTGYYQQLRIHELELKLGEPHITDEDAIHRRHGRQRRMIIGESIFILVSISIGIWLMMRSLLEEIRINRQRRNFLFSVTHELKTPIAAIRLVLDTLQKRELPREQQLKLISTAGKETNRLKDTMDNLLLAARINHQYQPRIEQREIVGTIKDWVEDIKQQYPQRVLVFEMPIEPSFLTLDWSGLEVVLRNLVENALKYSPHESAVQIKVSHTRKGLTLEVSDEGPGIPDNEKTRIFDMFYRIGDEDHRSNKGTGLGLFLSREITLRNHGQLLLKDNTPKGSIFTIQWPVHAETNSGSRR